MNNVKTCHTCKFEDRSVTEYPCNQCFSYSAFIVKAPLPQPPTTYMFTARFRTGITLAEILPLDPCHTAVMQFIKDSEGLALNRNIQLSEFMEMPVVKDPMNLKWLLSKGVLKEDTRATVPWEPSRYFMHATRHGHLWEALEKDYVIDSFMQVTDVHEIEDFCTDMANQTRRSHSAIREFLRKNLL